MEKLKLTALSIEDLQILSSVLQDAIVRVGDIKFDGKARSLTLRVSRFSRADPASESVSGLRYLTGVQFADITDLQVRAIDRSDPDAMMVLLAIKFTATRPKPTGVLSFLFAGGGEIKASVECIHAVLADISEGRATDKIPMHSEDKSAQTGGADE